MCRCGHLNGDSDTKTVLRKTANCLFYFEMIMTANITDDSDNSVFP
jgi:hypothetical protein